MTKFLAKEKAELNQYWYSAETIQTIVDEIASLEPVRVAFISTPSIFAAAVQRGILGDLFDVDEQVCSDIVNDECKSLPFDFNFPLTGLDLHGRYDVAVIDPPFITQEVLFAYSLTVNHVVKAGGKLLISSIAENDQALREVYGRAMRSVPYKPSIPSLVYQYNLFVNYDIHPASGLAAANPHVREA